MSVHGVLLKVWLSAVLYLSVILPKMLGKSIINYTVSCTHTPGVQQCLIMCSAYPDCVQCMTQHGLMPEAPHLSPRATTLAAGISILRGEHQQAFAGHPFSFTSDIWIGNDGRGIKQGNPLTQGQTAGNSILVGEHQHALA